MGWDLLFKPYDLWERAKLVAGWFGLQGLLMTVVGVIWTWLCGIPWWLWYPAILLIVGSVCFVKAGWAVWQIKREARESASLSAKFGLFMEMIEATKRQGAGPLDVPQPIAAPEGNRVLKAEPGKFGLTGFPATLTHAPSEYIPLHDAMRLAYERTLTGTLSAFANGQADGDPNEVLNWYAYFSLKHLPIYGKRNPSTVPELFKPDLINQYYFLGGGTALAPKGNGPAYTDLSVKRGDLAAFFDKLVALDAEFAEVFGDA